MGRHYARRKDGNQKEIEQTLTDAGIPWFDTSRQGDGFPDLVAAPSGVWHILEIKLPGEDLTRAERTFHEKFKGAPLHIVHDGQHALYCMGVIDSYEPTQQPAKPRRSKKAVSGVRQSRNAPQGVV